jgi:hypothetical protein
MAGQKWMKVTFTALLNIRGQLERPHEVQIVAALPPLCVCVLGVGAVV